MTSSARPQVDCEQLHTALAVTDLEAAIDFYVGKLGFELGFTWGTPPTFGGINFGKVQIFLSTGTPTPNPTAAAAFFVVDAVDALWEFHTANGVEVAQPIANRSWNMRDYVVRDLHGYNLVFGQYVYSEGPRVEIERVPVSVRLEKRLAALLQDLAVHKRMSVDSVLEEMILHTNDGVGPHTKATLQHIQQLKAKHQIDYDCHASYRFTEKSTAPRSGG